MVRRTDWLVNSVIHFFDRKEVSRASSKHDGEEKLHTRFWWENLREGDHLEVPSLEGRIVLKWIFENWSEGHGLDRSGSEQGQVAGSCECGNERSSPRPHPTSRRSILMWSICPWVIQVVFFLQVCTLKPCMHFYSPLYVVHVLPVWFRGFFVVTWLIILSAYLLARRPTPKLEDHFLSAVRDCLFNTFAATLHNWRTFLHPLPEDVPCRGDRDPLITGCNVHV
jgi:hypothetical protein